MTKHFTQQASAFGLAAIVTLAMLAGIDQLAVSESARASNAEMSQSTSAPVVVTATPRGTLG